MPGPVMPKPGFAAPSTFRWPVSPLPANGPNPRPRPSRSPLPAPIPARLFSPVPPLWPTGTTRMPTSTPSTSWCKGPFHHNAHRQRGRITAGFRFPLWRQGWRKIYSMPDETLGKVWQAADGLHLDVRGLPPPEPMVAILLSARREGQVSNSGNASASFSFRWHKKVLRYLNKEITL